MTITSTTQAGLKILSIFSKHLLALLTLALPVSMGLAAPVELQKTITTIATPYRDAQGHDWAYVAWTSGDLSLLYGKTLGVFVKSDGTFQRRAVVKLQTDPAVIASLLARGNSLGSNNAALEAALDGIFSSHATTSPLSLHQKAAAVLQAASSDAGLFGLAAAVGESYPGMNLCLGLAHALRLGSGETTMELRMLDSATLAEQGVVGRTTVVANQPVVLPAPGIPQQTIALNLDGTPSATEHLTISLKWAAPEALRRLSPFTKGCNLYRLTKALATAQGMVGVTAPTNAQLAALLVAHPNEARKVNSSPIHSKSGDFPYSFVDQNDFGDTPDLTAGRFVHGSEYVYFAVACDVLGRNGISSAGGAATACHTLPPPAPNLAHVENDYAVTVPTLANGDQRLKLVWEAAANTLNPPVTSYWIYRWNSTTELAQHAGEFAYHRIASGSTFPNNGSGFLSYIDNQPLPVDYLPQAPRPLTDHAGSPTSGVDDGKTFFYTVRSVAQCGALQLVSPHSAPIPGVLRDHVGPDAPTNGAVASPCYEPVVNNGAGEIQNYTDGTAPFYLASGLDPSNYYFDLVCQRLSPAISWVEFVVYPADSINACQEIQSFRVEFGDRAEDSTARMPFAFPRYKQPAVPDPVNAPLPELVRCRVGSDDGQVSAWGVFDITPALRGEVWQYTRITFQGNYVFTGTSTNPACGYHRAYVPGVIQKQPMQWSFDLSPTTKEWKLYRRVDQGPMDLVAQGLKDYSAVAVQNKVVFDDYTAPWGTSTICGYAQCFDQHGNASPMTLIGCRTVSKKPGAPLLAQIVSGGTAAAPEMKLQWTILPNGLERFQIFVAETNSGPVGSISGVGLTELMHRSYASDATGKSFIWRGLYQTARIGDAPGNLGAGPLFEQTIRIQKNSKYYVKVQALAAPNVTGEGSELREFTWQESEVVNRPPNDPLPWAPRPLPTTVSSAQVNPEILARRMTQRVEFDHDDNSTTAPQLSEVGEYPVGVRIGAIPVKPKATDGRLSIPLPDWPYDFDQELSSFLFAMQPATRFNLGAKPILPVMLYRQQVANAEFPIVSNDVSQVSPLIDKVAEHYSGPVGDQSYRASYDPYILAQIEDSAFRPKPDLNDVEFLIGWVGLYLVDTQPVIEGAKYRYFLVQFTDRGEVKQVIQTNDVEINP